ncbi:MAG: SpoIIE family protein phosphatase [Prevotella sp.]|nr:SpoIIE family protein phosphatase [Prevotella sp.]
MAVKILSVDDEMDLELLLTQYFRRKIRKGEYEFVFAHNGMEALAMMVKHPDIEIILSDINMPEMDGLTLLAKVNEMRNPAMKVIMVSAYGDMGNIRQAMNNGAFDFATKPIDLDDLSITIEKAIEQIEYVHKSQKEHTQLESLRTDLAIASQIQQAILPQVFPPFPEDADKVDIAASMTPAKDVGGDFYDFFRIDDNHIGLVIADVSGKGIPAAIFMAVSRTLTRATGIRGGNPADCISYANKLLAAESVNCMFVTMFYGILDVNTGEVVYCNAGHNPPYIVRQDGEVKVLPMTQDPMVGAIGGIVFHQNTVQLAAGDALVMFTDGVTEAMNGVYEAYGEQRLEATLAHASQMSSQEIVDAIKADVATFVDGAEQSDDITVLVLKKK